MNKHQSSHAPIDCFSIDNNELLIGGKRPQQLEHMVGHTPYYAYDREVITERIRLLRHSLPKQVELHYAVKANPMPAVVQHIAHQVDGLDVASQKELLTALDTGMPASEISFAGPGKKEGEISAALAAGIVINVESVNELQRIQRLAEQQQAEPHIALRINPHFELKASGMKMTGGAKPFGIDQEYLPDILDQLPEQGLSLSGLHIFTGSQNLSEAAIMEAHDRTFELATQMMRLCHNPLKFVNIGGGLGIPYFPNDKHLQLDKICKNLTKNIKKYARQFKECKIVIELGRYIVGEAGVYVCKIIDKKISRGHTYLVTDGGLHQHLANSGNFGQVIRKNYPVIIANRVSSKDLEEVSIVGPLCTPLDIIADKMQLPAADIGDYVAVMRSGAYGLTASPQDFLSHPRAVEILV